MTTQTVNKDKIIDINEIMQFLPHRYPFLLVDRVIDFEEGKWLKAIKNVSINEPCFSGHFPQKPIFPGVLILEAMAQATGVLAFKTLSLPKGELFYFAAVDKARFKRIVEPGDQMILEVNFIKERRGITRFSGIAMVDGHLVCEAELMCARKNIKA